jgi:hypothetical protein
MLVIKLGSHGEEVRQIQTELQRRGYYAGPIDGAFGGGTASAVKAFQFSNALPVDGQVGPDSWGALFGTGEMPPPAIFNENLNYRCVALTGAFETDQGAPDCFCAVSGDFDGQGMSFGVLQWNFGQGTLQLLLQDFIQQHPDVARSVFQDELNVVSTALQAPRDELFNFVRTIQHPIKHTINEPWRGMAKALGRTPEFQAIQVNYAGEIFDRSVAMRREYALSSQRAVALMFDICVQNGSITDLVKARILADFARLPTSLDAPSQEVQKMQIIANRRAEVANPRWVEDVRSRKLAIAKGEGVVHGIQYDLAAQYNVTLDPYRLSA